MRRFLIIAILLLSVSSAYAMGNYIVPAKWNYRLTVEVETPEGLKTGSSVRQVAARLQFRFPGPEVLSVVHDVTGEAVVVDLGKRGVLFALIDWDSFEDVYNAFPPAIADRSERLKYYESLASGTSAELKKKLPTMVTFRDRQDPRSVEVVYKESDAGKTATNINRFEEAFGKGVKLGRVSVEMTDDPVTFGKIIFPDYKTDEFQNWYNSLPYGDMRRVHAYHMRRGK